VTILNAKIGKVKDIRYFQMGRFRDTHNILCWCHSLASFLNVDLHAEQGRAEGFALGVSAQRDGAAAAQ
jgi:hypothetical protein